MSVPAAPYPGMDDDIRLALAQPTLHCHAVAGVWDPDTMRAGQRCVECAARARLQVWLDGSPADAATVTSRARPFLDGDGSADTDRRVTSGGSS